MVVKWAWSFRGLRAERREKDRLSSIKRAGRRDGAGSDGPKSSKAHMGEHSRSFYQNAGNRFSNRKIVNVIDVKFSYSFANSDLREIRINIFHDTTRSQTISLYACSVIRHWKWGDRWREREKGRKMLSLDVRRGAGLSVARVNAPL